jgi:prepilin-type processing-associated H-X9-DG protein
MRSAGPLRTLLESLQLPDLTELHDLNSPLKPQPGRVPVEMPVPGFVCASDPNATAGIFSAPISYRATTGDSPSGDDGVFAPGRLRRLRDVEAADGLSYTAAFSERLAGDNQPNAAAPGNYRVVPGPLSGTGCPGDGGLSGWRGDAGSSWAWADYRFTLYNHALLPDARPSCVASDGKSAFMGASSGHDRGVNLLLLDGSVTVVRPSIDPKVWREFARINPPEPTEPPTKIARAAQP